MTEQMIQERLEQDLATIKDNWEVEREARIDEAMTKILDFMESMPDKFAVDFFLVD
jgi:hypothetical protein